MERRRTTSNLRCPYIPIAPIDFLLLWRDGFIVRGQLVDSAWDAGFAVNDVDSDDIVRRGGGVGNALTARRRARTTDARTASDATGSPFPTSCAAACAGAEAIGDECTPCFKKI